MRPHLCLLVVVTPVLGAAQDTNESDEPLAESYSFDRGVALLEEVTTRWSERKKCVTCHTNGLALITLPIVASESEGVERGRTFASDYLQAFLLEGEEPKGQRGSLEGLVATTAFLAFSDARTDVGVQRATRLGLDHAWETLDATGVWEDWLQCNWPPYEVDVEFGPALMLAALGELDRLGERSGLTASDREGVVRLSGGLRKRPPRSLHDKAMRLWAGVSWPELAPPKDRSRWRAELLEAQLEDGGWSMASLAADDWRRDGDEPQTPTSEAYPTAFATYVLLQVGAERESAVVRRALTWLRAHQRESGRWFTRSPRRDSRHYISHAATAFALLCLADD